MRTNKYSLLLSNKYLIYFLSLFIFLAGGYSFVLAKFLPILVHHTFYYCQEMAKVITLNLPGNLGTIVFVGLLVSILYAIARLITTIIRIYKFRRTLSRSVVSSSSLTKIINNLKLKDKVMVLEEEKPYAYCFGVRYPKIYITTGLIEILSLKELQIVLRHEKYHLEHQDNLVLLIAVLIKSLFPFFPVLTDIIRIYKTDRELLADKYAIKNYSDRESLKIVLTKLLQYEPAIIVAIAPAIADVDTLEARIKSFLIIKPNYQKLGIKKIIFSIPAIILLLSLMWVPVNAFEIHQKGLDAMVVCNKNISCESICKVDNTRFIQSSPFSTSHSRNYSSLK